MTIKEFQEKEARLSERVSRLNSAIAEVQETITEANIENKAKELNSLKTQLSLTEIAHKKAQEQLERTEKFLASKEYKDKVKQQEELFKQAQKHTAGIYKQLLEIAAAAKEVHKTTEKLNKLERETLKISDNMKAYFSYEYKQPFSWLFKINAHIERSLKEARYISDKLEG